MEELSVNTGVNTNNITFKVIGKTSDNRTICEVTGLDPQNDKFTVPSQNVDKFEKLSTKKLPELQKIANNQEKYTKKFANIATISGIAGAVAGAGLALFCTRKSSVLKKVLWTTGSAILTGIAGCAASIMVMVNKTLGVGKEFLKLDIRPYNQAEKKESEVVTQKTEEIATQPEETDKKVTE